MGSVARGMCGLGIEPRKNSIRGADVVPLHGRHYRAGRYRETCSDPAWSKTPCTHRSILHGTREVRLLAAPCWRGPRRKSQGSTTAMNDHRKSDKPIVPLKGANKRQGRSCSAKRVEGRGLAKENSGEQTKF